MTAYDFTLIIDRNPATDEYADALFEVDEGDSIPEGNPNTNTGVVHVTRDADSLALAIHSAVRDVESTGLVVTGVQSDDLVTLKEIAVRVGRSYESVRLLAAGKRGPGGFPAPATGARENAEHGWAFYSWTSVGAWFAQHYGGEPVTDYDREIAAVDHLVRARHLLTGVVQRRAYKALVDA